MTLRQKHKVIRKVREHHKKKAKEAKKAKAEGRVRNVSRQAVRDPGIPNAWPFKEEELALLEARRARAVEEKERKKSEKKMRVSEGKK